MKVLIVCSRKEKLPYTDYMAPFVYEQVKTLEASGVECAYYMVSGGVKGYLISMKCIKRSVKEFAPDIVHAHFGLCGLVANMQRKVPVVTTFHGSDLNNASLRFLSRVAVRLSEASILVSEKMKRFAPSSRKVSVIPCGVDTSVLSLMDKDEARLKLGMERDGKYILFSKGFNEQVKNYPLAKAGVDLFNSTHATDTPAKLLEFTGYSREQVGWLFNAVDCVLMTSHKEGSPQFIKEAMACNCPIVSVDVGDVRQVISGIDGCWLADRTPDDIALKLALAIGYGRTEGRERILKEYDSMVIARRVIDVYESVLKQK